MWESVLVEIGFQTSVYNSRSCAIALHVHVVQSGIHFNVAHSAMGKVI